MNLAQYKKRKPGQSNAKKSGIFDSISDAYS